MAEQVRRAEVAALRAQKLPAFVPSKAHIVFGHGEEVPTNSFVLPPTCMVVAVAYPGELMFFKTIIPMIQKLGCMDPRVLRNPLENPDVLREIVNLTGGVVVYKPGEQCPNFKYILLQYYTTTRLSKLNGIVEIDEDSCERFKLLGLEDTHTVPYESYESSEGKGFLYEHSVYPTKELFAQQVAEKKAASGYAPYMHQLTKVNPVLSCLSIDQRTICSKFPGVFFNFVCREVGGVTSTLFGSGLPRQSYLYEASILNEATPAVQPLLKQRIANAERRKKLMPGAYLNQDAAAGSPTKLLWHGVQFLSPRNIQTAIAGGADLEEKENEFTPLEALAAYEYDAAIDREVSAVRASSILLIRAGAAITEKVVENFLKFPLEVKGIDGVSNEFPILEAIGERGVFAEPGKILERMEYIKFDYRKGLLQTLIRYGFNLLEVNETGNTYLMSSLGSLLIKRHRKFITDLLEAIPHLHTQNADGNTVLHIAISLERTEFVSLLLEKGPGLLEIPNAQGDTPLKMAMRVYANKIGKSSTILNLLLSHIPPPNVLGPFMNPDETLANYFGYYRNKLGAELTDKFKELWLAQGGDAAVLEEMMAMPAYAAGGGSGRKQKLKSRRRRGRKSPSRTRKHRPK